MSKSYVSLPLEIFMILQLIDRPIGLHQRKIFKLYSDRMLHLVNTLVWVQEVTNCCTSRKGGRQGEFNPVKSSSVFNPVFCSFSPLPATWRSSSKSVVFCRLKKQPRRLEKLPRRSQRSMAWKLAYGTYSGIRMSQQEREEEPRPKIC